MPSDDPNRNEIQARQALLDHVTLDPYRVHAMSSSDGEFGDDVDAAAAAYGDIIDARDGLDLVMLVLWWRCVIVPNRHPPGFR